MKTQHVLMTVPFLAQVDFVQRRFVALDGDACGAGELALGLTECSVSAGETMPVNTHGVLLVESGGAIAAKSPVTSDASARAVPQANNDACNGYALDAATGAGEIIRIIRGI